MADTIVQHSERHALDRDAPPGYRDAHVLEVADVSHQQRDLGTTGTSDQVHRLHQGQPADVFAVHGQYQVAGTYSRLFGRRAGDRGNHRQTGLRERDLRSDALKVTAVAFLFARVLFRAEVGSVGVFQGSQHPAYGSLRQLTRTKFLVVYVFIQQDAVGLAHGTQFSRQPVTWRYRLGSAGAHSVAAGQNHEE